MPFLWTNVSTAQIVLGVGYDLQVSNLRSHEKLFSYLSSDKYFQDVRQSVQKKKNRLEVLAKVREIVTEKIYQAHTPITPASRYTRSNALMGSFVVEPGENSAQASLAIKSDPAKKGGKKTIHNKTGTAASKGSPEESYAEYFDNLSLGTFIKPSGTPHRPFTAEMIEFLGDYMTTKAIEAYEQKVKDRMKKLKKLAVYAG